MTASRPAWRRVVEMATARPVTAMILFVGLLAALVALAALRIATPPLDTDLFALVSPASGDPARTSAMARIRTLSEQRQTWLVAHPDRAAARAAALALETSLAASDVYVRGAAAPDLTDIVAFYEPYRLRLADPAAAELSAEAQVERVLRSLYGITSATALPGVTLERDPLQRFSRFLLGLATVPAPFSIDRGLLVGRLDGLWTYVLPMTLAGSAFDFALQDQTLDLEERVAAELSRRTGARIASVGVIDFARANRALALREVSLIGGASLALIALLLGITFRRARVFVAVAVTIGSGVLAGLAVSSICFRSVHVMTLVGGASLIGISVDYAFHLLADSFRAAPSRWTVGSGLHSVLPAITLGLATSLLGLAGLAVSGFIGLQQIAVFSAAGLIGAYLSLLGTYPLLLRGWQGPRQAPASLALARAWLSVWRPGRRTMIGLAVGAVLVTVLFPAPRSESDVRLLAARSAEIDALLERSARLSATLLDSRFFLVQAPDAATLLEHEEALRFKLESLKRSGAISHFTQLAQFVPSPRRQDAVLARNRTLLAEPGTATALLERRLGLNESALATLRTELESPDPPRLELSHWLTSPLGPLAGHLYLGRITPDSVASIVTLAGVRDVAALAATAEQLTQVSFVDNVAELGEVFGLYTDNAIRGLGIAFVLVSALMILAFGWREGAATVLVPLVAFAATLALLELLGERVNLFHIVGLTLVLGMGMDYTLFLKSGEARPPTMLAVILAAATTECAFGLLGLSRVQALHAFGLTVAIGTLLTFLLAPMVAGYHARATGP